MFYLHVCFAAQKSKSVTSSVPDESNDAAMRFYERTTEPHITFGSFVRRLHLPTVTFQEPWLSRNAEVEDYVLVESETNEQLAARFQQKKAQRMAEHIEYVDVDIPISLAGAVW